MPVLQILTNVSKASLPTDFVSTTSDAFEKLIGKPKKFICVHIQPDQMFSFGGSQEPCAIVNLTALTSKISKDENKTYSEKITEILASIGVKKDRMYINYHEMTRENIGYDGTTFAFWTPK